MHKLLAALFGGVFAANAAAGTFETKGHDFLLDGKPFLIRSGEMHYPRVPLPYWHDRLKKAKAMGLNTICTYLFWNVHEPQPGKWDFEGTADFVAFIKACQEEGLYVLVRPGPYVCTEWEFGGFPGWLLADPQTVVRSTDPKFLKPAIESEFTNGSAWQEIRFATPLTGRYFALESLDAYDGKGFAAVAEMMFADKSGKDVPREQVHVVYADSEELTGDDGGATNAIDNQPTTFWHSEWKAKQPLHPQALVLDLGAEHTLSGFRYLPRAGSGGEGGRIKRYRAFVSKELFQGL